MKEQGPHHKTECKKNCKGGSTYLYIVEIFRIKRIHTCRQQISRLPQKVLNGQWKARPVFQS